MPRLQPFDEGQADLLQVLLETRGDRPAQLRRRQIGRAQQETQVRRLLVAVDQALRIDRPGGRRMARLVVKTRGDMLQLLRQGDLEDLVKQRVLAGEMGVQRRLAHTGQDGDFVQRRSVIAVIGEMADGHGADVRGRRRQGFWQNILQLR